VNSSGTSADALTERAHIALQSGDAQAAEALCRQALEREPARVDALTLLGVLQLTQAHYGEAEVVFDHLCTLRPEEAAFWVNLGTARRGQARYDDAISAFARAAALGESSADFYYNVGLTHAERCDYESARAVLKRALDLAPADAEIRYRFAFCCYEAMQFDEAIAALEPWTDATAAPPAVAANVSQLLMSLGAHERAEPAVRSVAAGGRIDNPQAALTYVQILERTNRIAEADDLLQRLAADPRAAFLGTDLQLAQAKIAQRQSKHELAADMYRKMLPLCREIHQRHFILYPLATSLDALGQYDEAFATLNEAHVSHVAHIRLTAPLAIARGVPQMTVTQFGCEPADIARWDDGDAPALAESPVFVVAFPRSGTTLLELMLDAHPQLRSMDEQPFLQNALEDIRARNVDYPAGLAELTESQLREIRARYMERVGKKISLESGQRLVDKNPLNILRLPVIRRIFPNSTILLAIRHPCDVLLSCYMQHFRSPDFALLCANMPLLAQGYRRSFDYWYEQAALLSPRVHELRYEDLVADPETGIRRVAAFLELPWDDAMLAPAARAHAKRFISTPSYSQVVQPINTRSVGRWHPYREYFEPVLPLVAPYLTRWGYDDGGS
jgi:tetratricopeptide (TPR) repeat protein